MPLKAGGGHTKVFKGGVRFTRELQVSADNFVDIISGGSGRAGNGKVINLATQEDRSGAKFMGNINIAFMGGVLEVQFGSSEDGIDVVFPETSTFGMSLKGTSNGDNERMIQGDAKTMLVPFREDVVNGEESGSLGAWRMGVCIASVASKDEVVKGSGEGAEKAKDGSFNTRRVGFCKLVKDRNSTGGSIATMAGAAFSTWLNFILPMRAEDDGIFGTRTRGAKHAKVLELIALFAFGCVPEWPGREGF
jgi:hypothetical protein